MKKHVWLIVVTAIAIACTGHHSKGYIISPPARQRIVIPEKEKELPTPEAELLPAVAVWYL